MLEETDHELINKKIEKMERKVQCSLQFCVKLIDIAGRKIQTCKIGIINLMVILYIFFYTCNYTSYTKEKYRKTNIVIIHKKINLSDQFIALQNWNIAKLEPAKLEVGGLLKWIKDFLCNREMRTVIKDQK